MPTKIGETEHSSAEDRLRALDDGELEAVGGGYEIVFDERSVNRDSWFVSIVTRQMIQNSIRSYLSSPGQTVPEVITVGERRYRVRQIGETIHVEAF